MQYTIFLKLIILNTLDWN